MQVVTFWEGAQEAFSPNPALLARLELEDVHTVSAKKTLSLVKWLAQFQQETELTSQPQQPEPSSWIVLVASPRVTWTSKAQALWQETLITLESKPEVLFSYANAWLTRPWQAASTSTRPQRIQPEWLLQQNVLGPVIAVRRSHLQHLPLQRVQAESSLQGQWHALALELMLYAKTQRLKDHCFWQRAYEVPHAIEQAFYFASSGLSERIRRFCPLLTGYEAVFESLETPALPHQAPAFTPQLPEGSRRPLVSILLPFRNRPELLRVCLDSILERALTYPEFEVVGINNQSDCPETLALMEAYSAKDSRIRFIDYNHPFNYSAINNEAARQAKGEYLLLLNNDIELISPNWLERLMGWAQLPHVGAVGAKLYYPNNTVQHVGCTVGLAGVVGHSFKHLHRLESDPWHWTRLVRNVSSVTGALLLVKAEKFWEVGGLDEAGFIVAFNDIDLCLKLEDKGYINLLNAHCEAYHFESISRKRTFKAQETKEEQLFKERFAERLQGVDPYYSIYLNHLNEMTLPTLKEATPIPEKVFHAKLCCGYRLRVFRQNHKLLWMLQHQKDRLHGLDKLYFSPENQG